MSRRSTKRRVGRPSGKKFTEYLAVNITAEMDARVRALADRRELPLSFVARDLLKRGLDSAGA